jgi:hypothetical protein
MQETKGSFLMEKAANMRKWLQSEIQGVSAIDQLKELSQIEAVYAAESLIQHQPAIAARDFSIIERLGVEDVAWKEILLAIRGRAGLHDKFWRYAQLFVEVAGA